MEPAIDSGYLMFMDAESLVNLGPPVMIGVFCVIGAVRAVAVAGATYMDALRWVLKHRPLRIWLVGVASVLMIVALGYYLVWVRPQLDVPTGVTPDRRIELVNDSRRTWGGVFAGILGAFTIVGLFLRSWAAMRQAAAVEQGNITERYTRAIDQLGRLNEGDYTPHRIIRLGGIYALEGIADDTGKMGGRDGSKYHDQIIDVLAAYVRESAPYDPAKKQLLARKPSEDVQAALTVIGRLGNVKDRAIDLSHTNLQKANLSNAIIHNVSFEHSLLDGADLHGAVMPWGWFLKASLRGAFLDEADLSHGEFSEVALDEAKLHLTKMKDARLAATLSKSSLDFTDLRNAFIAADVSDTTFDGTDLRGADLRQCTGLSILKLVCCPVNIGT